MNSEGTAFSRLVHREFDGHLLKLGYVRDYSGDTSASYKLKGRSIVVYLDIRSGEVDLSLDCGRSRLFSMSELVRFCGHPEAETYKSSLAVDEPGIERGVARLAKYFGELVSIGLIVDEASCEGLFFQQRQLAIAMERSTLLEQARRAAQKAWANRDYSEVVRAFSGVSDWLEESERKKLEIAKVRAGGG